MASPNPHDPGVPLTGKQVADTFANESGKILAILMHKLKLGPQVIGSADIEAFMAADLVLLTHHKADGIHFELTTPAEAQRRAYASRHKGFGRS